MGGIITFVLAALVLGYGGYALVKGLKREVKGEGCSGCSGCSLSKNCKSRNIHDI
ncbi:FeoB-associated Cys-rich membrane protein [Maledivibacter halophilus]|uniref:Virus attachment protein p12 family n=1 Tax=Maledivibacter halophilus TaxID=36842 RepID=A0A1T5LZD7_9FIRM|nr:FeoB-associated Cys-rich membrane protein [Maledivibacter halophilus]SKC81253.1 Virus attachment protein p12 family [Maledivibacter halophilus]